MSLKTLDLPIFLGSPVGACGHWGGQVYPAGTPRSGWLSWCSDTFNTVEGNSAFDALPKPAAIQRWAEQTAEEFRFALKFSRTISHDLQLGSLQAATQDFLSHIERLWAAGRLGPAFLQLGPWFGPNRFHVLAHFLMRLPQDFSWAVELRHVDWFDSGDHEKRVNAIFQRLEIDKVLFDSRPLFQSPPDDLIEKVLQERKSRTPVRKTVTGKHAILRLVGRNRVELTDRFMDQWAAIITGWVQRGVQLFFLYMHRMISARRRWRHACNPRCPRVI